MDVGEENAVSLEPEESEESMLVSRRGPGDSDLHLAGYVPCEPFVSGNSTDRPVVSLAPILPSDGESGSEDRDEQGEIGVRGSQNPCESLRSADPGLVGGGEERLSIKAGLSCKGQPRESKAPILEVSSSSEAGGLVSFVESDAKLSVVITLAGVVGVDVPRLTEKADICDNDP